MLFNFVLFFLLSGINKVFLFNNLFKYELMLVFVIFSLVIFVLIDLLSLMFDKLGSNGNLILIIDDFFVKIGNFNKIVFCNVFLCCFLIFLKILLVKILYVLWIELFVIVIGVIYLLIMCLGVLLGLKLFIFSFLILLVLVLLKMFVYFLFVNLYLIIIEFLFLFSFIDLVFIYFFYGS